MSQQRHLDLEGQAIRRAALIDSRCPECGRVRGPKHRETCPGPLQRIAPPAVHEPLCECPPGAWHEPGCPVAYWPPRDAA